MYICRIYFGRLFIKKKMKSPKTFKEIPFDKYQKDFT